MNQNFEIPEIFPVRGASDLPESSQFHLIGEVESLVELDAKTIRFYERAGLLQPRRSGRFRVFSQQDIERLHAIKLLRGLDLPLTAIRKIMPANNEFGLAKLSHDPARAVILAQIEKVRARQAAQIGQLNALNQMVAR